jgi:transposase InsO family protein
VFLLHNAELLAGEQFSTLHEAKVPIEQWRRHYNTVRPHSSLGYRPPAPETILPRVCPTLRSGQSRRWPIAAGL